MADNENWYVADPLWEIFGVQNKEGYIKDNVITVHFHAHVTAYVVKTYKTAEYLMAHAYFHWPLFDEALKTILSI